LRKVLAMPENTIALAADHAGYELKNALKAAIEERGLKVLDLGAHDSGSVDYPDMAGALAAALGDGRAFRGVLICGTGIGISIAANRHRHVRAALCHDVTTAKLARQHNDANVLAMGSRVVGPNVARDCLEAFLDTPFEGGRHQRRVDKLS
jgi:ribose 5-phosphate isomerase B